MPTLRETEKRRRRNSVATVNVAPQTVTLTLRDYWFETISKKEALRRLRNRPNLTSDDRADIAKNIPERTIHYLTFHGSSFREYADFGDGRGFLILLLPIIRDKTGKKIKVIAPVYRNQIYPDGSIESTSGIDLHQYHSKAGVLFEDGLPRETFRFSSEPVSIPINMTFLAPPTSPGVGPAECCNACEWLHSALHIHKLDPICCTGVYRIPKHYLPIFV